MKNESEHILMHKSIKIKTERLFLRTLAESDAALLKDYIAEVETEEEAMEWIRGVTTRNSANDVCFMFYIWLIQSNELIGRVYFHKKVDLDNEVEIGYWTIDEHRNKGYATEAAKAVVKFAFEQAGQDELAAIIDRENIASRRVIEKLGFVYHGERIVYDNNENRKFDYFKLMRVNQKY